MTGMAQATPDRAGPSIGRWTSKRAYMAIPSVTYGERGCARTDQKRLVSDMKNVGCAVRSAPGL